MKKALSWIKLACLWFIAGGHDHAKMEAGLEGLEHFGKTFEDFERRLWRLEKRQQRWLQKLGIPLSELDIPGGVVKDAPQSDEPAPVAHSQIEANKAGEELPPDKIAAILNL